jgi:hypothetical protein
MKKEIHSLQGVFRHTIQDNMKINWLKPKNCSAHPTNSGVDQKSLFQRENLQKDLGEFLDSYMKKYAVPFRRESPRDLAARLVRIFPLFTLPSTPDSLLKEATRVKSLYSLWVSVLDDRIDCDCDGKEDLFDTVNVLLRGFSEGQIHASTATGQIMKDFLDGFFKLPLGPNSDAAKEFLFLDLLQITNAFNYERIVLANNEFSTLTEYMDFSTSTFDAMCMLDVDLTLMQEEINPLTIGKLREIFKLFGIIFRLLNDIVTFEREFFSERSLNSILLRGFDRGVLPRNVLQISEEEKKRIYEEDISILLNDVKAEIKSYKWLVASRISEITALNLEFINQNLDQLVNRASSDGFTTVE